MARMNKQQRELLAELKERHQRCVDADSDNRQKCSEDIEFCYEPGEQWEDWLKQERGSGQSGGRPCYEFNNLRVSVKRIVNDLRANRPTGRVLASEDGDKDTASVLEGLIRNIWNNSDADTVIDQASEYQVAGGMGAWRITTKYASDSAWDLDLVIEGFDNPLCVYVDPNARDPMHRDAEYWIVTSRMSKAAFEAAYPDAAMDDYECEDDDEDWEGEDSIRVCEYWYRVPETKTLVLLSNGETVDASQIEGGLPEGITEVRRRSARSWKIKMCIASGSAILTEADWVSDEFPFVLVYGERLYVAGKRRWFGAVRHSKDAQRAYNYSRTSAIENVALAPQAKYWATPAQALGHTAEWKEAHSKLYPFLLYNPDQQAPGPPAHLPGADVPQAIIAEIQMAREDIKSTLGIYDAALGNRSNETSGIAIRSRQQQSEISTYNYQDNLGKAVRRTWELLVNAIPKVYDTERSVRILGADGAESFARVNAIGPDGAALNDLSRGKFDVIVTTGPSFTSQREQAAEIYMGMTQAQPGLMPIAGDLIFKSLDLPYSDDIAERMKAMLPPQIQQVLQAKEQGKPMPPEVQQAMAQADQAMQQVQMMAQQMQADAGQLDQKKAEVDKALADLEVKKAQFEGTVAKRIAEITTREAQFTLQQAQQGADAKGQETAQDRAELSAQVQQAIADVQAQQAQFMQQCADVITQMQMAQQPQVVVANPPRNKVVRVKRINGELIGTVEEQ